MSLPEGFKPTCMAHPDTYLNKLVVGSEGGQLVLLNFVTGWTGIMPWAGCIGSTVSRAHLMAPS